MSNRPAGNNTTEDISKRPLWVRMPNNDAHIFLDLEHAEDELDDTGKTCVVGTVACDELDARLVVSPQRLLVVPLGYNACKTCLAYDKDWDPIEKQIRRQFDG